MRKAGANCPNLAFERSSNGIASPDRPSRNMRVQFDDVSTSGPEPLVVGYRHRIGLAWTAWTWTPVEKQRSYRLWNTPS